MERTTRRRVCVCTLSTHCTKWVQCSKLQTVRQINGFRHFCMWSQHNTAQPLTLSREMPQYHNQCDVRYKFNLVIYFVRSRTHFSYLLQFSICGRVTRSITYSLKKMVFACMNSCISSVSKRFVAFANDDDLCEIMNIGLKECMFSFIVLSARTHTSLKRLFIERRSTFGLWKEREKTSYHRTANIWCWICVLEGATKHQIVQKLHFSFKFE